MADLVNQLCADRFQEKRTGPRRRARVPDADSDLCYVCDRMAVTNHKHGWCHCCESTINKMKAWTPRQRDYTVTKAEVTLARIAAARDSA